ncbi:hypothetical protein PQX77_012525 [Marasmius sp. AFHP31]|nr:hypothetical protein PQX77_012525 [Marasmius sp. AFHP31]
MGEHDLSDVDMSDIGSETETVCSDISEAETAVEPEIQVAPDRLVHLASQHECYLTQKRYNDFAEYKQQNPGTQALLPPPYSIEFSFNDFTSALARSYLAARYTPPSLTPPGSPAEFADMGRQLNLALDTSVPTAQHESNGNALEVKRMIFTSVIRWANVWDKLPDGMEKRLLYKDIAKFIEQKAKSRWEEDTVNDGSELAYRNVDWRVVMQEDLARSKWEGWRRGAL